MKTVKELKQELDLEKSEKKAAVELQKKKIAKRLRETILANGISIAQFARACNLPHETLKKYVSGERLIRVDNLIPMAKELKVSIDYLLCIDDEKTTTEAIPIRQRIAEATNLNSDAISTLISHKNETEYIECINTILEEKTILDRFVKYFIFIKNENVYKWNAQSITEYNAYKDIVDSKTKELESLPQAETIDSGNIYLYQLLKDFEATIEHKYHPENEDFKEAYIYQLMKEIETAVERKLKNKNRKGAK